MFCAFFVVLSPLPVLAAPVVIVVPDDYASIQEAINHSWVGDTVFVKSGVYTENVVVDKDDLKLIGESKETTIIDGDGLGIVVYVEANNSEISNFTLQNSGSSLVDSGVYLNNSCNVLVSDNKLRENHLGIYVSSSSNCVLRNNNLTQNQYNFGLSGSSLQEFIHDVDVSNLVNGKPVFYYVNESNKQTPADAGYVAFINSTNVTVENLNLTNNWQSILLAYTTDSQVRTSTLSSNMDALWLIDCLNCSVYENNVQNNDWGGVAIVNSRFCKLESNDIAGNTGYGVFLSDSSDNVLYHNNFNNTNQVWLFGFNSNSWDLGDQIGGNYWSDYNGEDVNGDGIGDLPYVIASGNEDFFPLMQPYVSSEEPSTDFVLFVLIGIVILVAVAIFFLFFLKPKKRGVNSEVS
ncbi:MAG: hypothetical protein CW716_00515 [Candidatus Bathyarchaeum sp.]|nr:MAG: hypothetical protein CW716_00515 [Candidatus Bathyarchaeum sp.]